MLVVQLIYRSQVRLAFQLGPLLCMLRDMATCLDAGCQDAQLETIPGRGLDSTDGSSSEYDYDGDSDCTALPQ